MNRSFAAIRNFRNLFLIVTRYRSRIDHPIPHCHPDVPLPKHRWGGSDVNQGLQLVYADHEAHTESASNFAGPNVVDRIQQSTPSLIKPVFPSWTRWILGALLSLVLPFWKEKWNKLLILEGELEMVADAVENVAEAVERVAVVTEKLSTEVAEKIPGAGKLKKAALLVERISTEAAKDARLTEDIIHKVEELKEEVESLLEPVSNRKKFALKKFDIE